MKAAVLTKLNEPLEVLDVGLTPLSYGQVQVRMLASGICGAQLQEIRGEKGNAKFIPHLLGHEGAGIVYATGVGVTKVKPGDKVVCHWRKGDGIESEFPAYQLNGRTIRSGKVTTFSEQAIVSENRVTPVPEDTPVELCALLGCGLSTALGTIEREAQLRLGESILIVGVGGLGVNLIRAAKLAGAAHIVAVDVHESKAAVALEMGATAYLGSHETPLNLHGFDVIVDTTGNVNAISDSLTMLGPGGRFIMVGHPKPKDSLNVFDPDHLFGGEGKMIKATQGGGFQPSLDIPRYVRAYQAGILKLDGIITDVIPLSKINRGIDLVRQGQASRVLIDMGL